mmetsp:Transcript_18592/g.27966  ORF Transcript_18592/g.27966 Transcript_18592/m.27966 type:complete len:134 (-) Transcript_18592:62-463(-)
MFELYRKNMNLVDLHNKLRQGEAAMADIWKTQSWKTRHFAELLGFIEVNIFKSLAYFVKGCWEKMSHNEFRRRLAWAFLTLGQEPYMDDVTHERENEGSSGSGTFACRTPSVIGSASHLRLLRLPHDKILREL